MKSDDSMNHSIAALFALRNGRVYSSAKYMVVVWRLHQLLDKRVITMDKSVTDLVKLSLFYDLLGGQQRFMHFCIEGHTQKILCRTLVGLRRQLQNIRASLPPFGSS